MAENIDSLAGRLYAAYCEAVGGIAFNGDSLPTWEEFSTDSEKTTQADAWRVVARISQLPASAWHGAPEPGTADSNAQLSVEGESEKVEETDLDGEEEEVSSETGSDEVYTEDSPTTPVAQ